MKYRPFVSLFCLLLIVPLTIVESWQLLKDPSTDSVAATPIVNTSKYEESVVLLQTKILVGGLVYFDRHAASSPFASSFAESRTELLNTIKQSIAVFKESPEGLILQGSKTDSMLAMDLQLAHALNFQQEKGQLCNFFKQRPNLEEGTEATVINSLCQEQSAEAAETLTLDAEVEETLRKRYDWLGELTIQTYRDDSPKLLDVHSSLLDELQQAFFYFLIALFLGFPLLLLSALSSLVLAYRLLAKKANLRFTAAPISSYLLLEVFTFYLIGMLCLPKIIEFFSLAESKSSLLIVNVVGISGLLLVCLWPLSEGFSLSKIAQSIGLQWKSFSQSLRNILFAPYIYFSSLAPFLLMLVAYSLILSALGVDPSSGAHPVVPLLTKPENKSLVYLIVLMAVVVAPIIEEIMFRGFFYSWLRIKLHPALAIPISSFLFAALHPQGAVGLVPLTCIGMVLALIREWRNSLLTCMITHAIFNAVTLSLVLLMFSN